MTLFAHDLLENYIRIKAQSYDLSNNPPQLLQLRVTDFIGYVKQCSKLTFLINYEKRRRFTLKITLYGILYFL